MGNCMACHSQPKKQTRGPLIEGREMEVDASVSVEGMDSTSSKRYTLLRRRMQHGEVYQLAPFMMQSGMPLAPCRTTDNRKVKTRIVKIVVTAQEFQLLLSGSKKFQNKGRVGWVRQSFRMRGCQKWLPSLPTILETRNSIDFQVYFTFRLSVDRFGKLG
ncbi:hypothetical protein VNO77_25356 [Canavalia gladiata]|uniref:Uncharacterized protein n=1 Tax=Canavalia gladiata TaxID=3824 RepID=A0AAN9L800_CANGL